MPLDTERDAERAPDRSAAWNAWVDARVAIAIAGHQSVINDLAAASVEFSATVQAKLEAMERQTRRDGGAGYPRSRGRPAAM